MLDISSTVIHDFLATAGMPNYSLTKNSSTLAIQQIAKDIDSEEVQIVSFHPGAIYTSAAKRALGGKQKSEISFPFDEGEDLNHDCNQVLTSPDDLPGAFSVWAASDEARFLHGRFVWAAWDVEEMKQGEVAARIESEASFLKVGVPGLTNGTVVVA
jgi:NAD(P)-dependent dehydrogenase (short-subunit alcohol dehydrogenase family)